MFEPIVKHFIRLCSFSRILTILIFHLGDSLKYRNYFRIRTSLGFWIA